MELVKNTIGIYFFQKDSYLNFVKKSLLPVPYAILLLCVYSLSSACYLFIWGRPSWLIFVIAPLYRIFIVYLLAYLVYSQERGELESLKIESLFSLYTLLFLPVFISNDLFIRQIIMDSTSLLFSLIAVIINSLFFIWYLFTIKTLFELSWKNSLILGFKVLLLFITLNLLILLILFFFMRF